MKQLEALRLADWCETFNHNEMEATAAELRRLSAIEQAAQNLVKVKGRFHTERAFNQLKELLK